MGKETKDDKAPRQLSEQNQLIKQIEGSVYVKNPLAYSQIRGDFTLMQTNVLLAIVSTMQERINRSFVDGRMGPLFTQDELRNGKITFEVPFAALGVATKEYDAVHESCIGLTRLLTTYVYPETDQHGRRIGQRLKTSVIFTDVDVPMVETRSGRSRREGNIRISMNGTVAEQMFNTSAAYVEHLGGIAKLCRSPRSPRMYVYLSAWKNQKMCTFNYEALREFLGATQYNEDRTSITKGKEMSWAVFHRDVLDPAQRELKKLAERGDIEFYFTYEPLYQRGRAKRGAPDNVRFYLHPGKSQQQAPEPTTGSDTGLPWAELARFEQLRESLCERAGEKWAAIFRDTATLQAVEGEMIVVSVPSHFVGEEWERQGCGALIREIWGPACRVMFRM